MNTEAKQSMETIEPVGLRVLVRKDDDKKKTRGGIILPDECETPVLTGRIVAISAQVERDMDYPISKFDRVIINPSRSIPVELDSDNKLFLIPIEDVVGIIRKEE